MKYTGLSCIRCGKTFTPSGPDGDDTPPNDGLLFISYGNYGSTVYDPQGNGQEYLLVVLCDECAVGQAREQNVMHICKPVPVAPPPPRYRGPWIPDQEGNRTAVKPVYTISIWPEDGWWLARVTGVSDGGDDTPLTAVTQSDTREGIETMARDLVATILDTDDDEDIFDIEVVECEDDPEVHDPR